MKNGVICNTTLTSFNILVANSRNYTFVATGTSGPYLFIIPSNVAPNYVMEDGVKQNYGTVWTYDYTNNALVINTPTLSTWTIDFPPGVPKVVENIFITSLAGLGMFAVVPIISAAAAIITIVMMMRSQEPIDPKIIAAVAILLIAVNIIVVVGVLIVNGVHSAMQTTQFLLDYFHTL